MRNHAVLCECGCCIMKMSGFDALFVQAVSTDPMGMLCSVSD